MISCDDGENTTLSDADDPYVGVKCVILREQQIGRIGLSCRSEGRQRTGVRSRGSGLASVVTLTTPCRANPLMEGVPEPSSELEEKLTIDGSAHQAWNPGEDKVARGSLLGRMPRRPTSRSVRRRVPSSSPMESSPSSDW